MGNTSPTPHMGNRYPQESLEEPVTETRQPSNDTIPAGYVLAMRDEIQKAIKPVVSSLARMESRLAQGDTAFALQNQTILQHQQTINQQQTIIAQHEQQLQSFQSRCHHHHMREGSSALERKQQLSPWMKAVIIAALGWFGGRAAEVGINALATHPQAIAQGAHP